LLFAVREAPPAISAWLLEHGGADMADVTDEGLTVWDMLMQGEMFETYPAGVEHYGAAVVTTLLRRMVLRSYPPADLMAVTGMVPVHQQWRKGLGCELGFRRTFCGGRPS
jgi:hypothetical protein